MARITSFPTTIVAARHRAVIVCVNVTKAIGRFTILVPRTISIGVLGHPALLIIVQRRLSLAPRSTNNKKMKICYAIVVGSFLSLSVALFNPATAEDTAVTYTAEAYAICSACHLPDGNGVPSAFPPIRNRTAAIAAIDGGREYLVTAVSYGLMGTIEVAGIPYMGVMAGNNGMLSSEEIAAALNYVIFELDDAVDTQIDPFTREEVERIQSAVTNKGPLAAGELRKSIMTAAGDQWP